MRPEMFIAQNLHPRFDHILDHRFDNTITHETCNIKMAIDMQDMGDINSRLHILDLEKTCYAGLDQCFSKLSLSVACLITLGRCISQNTNLLDQMGGNKRTKEHDGEEMPAAKRHTSNGTQQALTIFLVPNYSKVTADLQTSKQSDERNRITAGNPVIIDLSVSVKKSPDATTPQRCAVMKRLPPISVSDNFPLFKDGTVIIILDPRVEKYQYKLHASALSHASPKFSSILKDTLLEASEELKLSATDAQFRFELVYSSSVGDWVLRKTPFTAWKILGGNGKPKITKTPLGTGGVIKEEPSESLEHKLKDIFLVPGAEVAHEESKDLTATLEYMEVSVPNSISTIVEGQNSHPVEVNQLKKELESISGEDNGDSTIPGQSTDDSMQGISTGPETSINVPNALEENISSARVPLQHIHPERLSTSSGNYVPPPVEVCEAFNNLFLTFYTFAPKISNTDIWIALNQCENVLEAAKTTESLPTVRPYLGAALLRFGDDLLEAIPEDPYRWLYMSLDLQCDTIFKEAMIHVVGQYSLAHDFNNTIPAIIPVNVQDIIIRKVRLLDSKKTIANERILVSTISIDGDPVTPMSPNPQSVATWFVVQIWRDWFIYHYFMACFDPYMTGALYRNLRLSGDTYLPATEVKEKIERIRCPVKVDMEDLKRDLDLLKALGQEAVEDLCENFSMMDMEGSAWDHLTCIAIRDEELPWYSPDHF